MRSGSNMGPGGRGEEVLSGRGLGENQRGPVSGFWDLDSLTCGGASAERAMCFVVVCRQSDVRGSQCGACDVIRDSGSPRADDVSITWASP